MTRDRQCKRARYERRISPVARLHVDPSRQLFKASWHERKTALRYSEIVAIANTKHCQFVHCGAEHIPETSSGGSRDHCDN